ncbi:MAG: PD-(D/E)XK nuclease family protein [Litorimonas sp.]
MSAPHVYNMPSGVPFLDMLAKGLRRRYGDELQSGLILLPTRRAVRGLGEAFVTAAAEDGVRAALLPRLRPLADIDPEEPPFEPGELVGKVRPAIDGTLRRFEMARVVAAYHERALDLPLDAATALAMADPLLAILDDAALEEAKLTETDAWARLMGEAAKHFQDAATLYKIIQDFWPARLAELNMEEPQTRKVKLLDALISHWTENPPDHPVIIAGSTGSLRATRRLMRVVANLPKGLVVLPGFQATDNDQTWESIDEQHPQYAMKLLINGLDVDRGDVRDFVTEVVGSGEKDLNRLARTRVLEEALVPASRTADWLARIEKLETDSGRGIFDDAVEGLSLLETRSDAEEALVIALILREALEDKNRTAALVTPDQALARRVRARLARWDVDVDMSQGEPLSETSIGVFLDAVLSVSQNSEGPLEKSILFGHPLAGLGQEPRKVLAAWHRIERTAYRVEIRPGDPKRELEEIEKALKKALQPLIELQSKAAAPVWASALIAASEQIATRPDNHGSHYLWCGEAGERAAQLLEHIIVYGDSLPEVDAEGFLRLMRQLMTGIVVRPRGGTHPRLSILGPLEARMLDADIIILGGLNEGTWPANPSPGPFLSRGMRRDMKLSLPERRYGLAAHDFFELASNPKVYLTRSKRSDSGPTIASRWVWRLKTLLQGAVGADGVKTRLGTSDHYLRLAQKLDYVSANDVTPAKPPKPMPPKDKRWTTEKGRSLSITEVKTFIRDPYSIYGKHVLGLKRLKDLGHQNGSSEFGSAIHLGIENFLTASKAPFTEGDDVAVIEAFDEAFRLYGYTEEVIAKEHARFRAIAENLRIELNSRHADGYEEIGLEVWGQAAIPDRDFSVRGKMDYVERGRDGYGFVDFKTGSPSSDGVVAAGFDPQLPLAAFILREGGLKGHKPADTARLGYMRVKGSNNDFKYSPIGKKKTVDELVDDSIDTLSKLIDRFDDPLTPYESQVRAQYTNSWSDFDDLARRAEWAGMDGGEGDA